MSRERWLRMAGWLCLLGFAGTAMIFLTMLACDLPHDPRLPWLLVGLGLLFLLTPPFLANWDLDTGKHRAYDKRTWRAQMNNYGAWGIVAGLFFLLRRDKRIARR